MASTDEKWNTIYPAYINSNRTLVNGRKISKGRAVADPKWTEIRDVLESIDGVKVLAEPNKVYPRELDKETCRGRIRYIVPENDKRSRKEILHYLGDMIPKLKSRSAKVQAQPAGPSSGPSGKKGRKGK